MKQYLFLLISLSQIVISCANIKTKDDKELSYLELQISDDLKDKISEAKVNSYTYKGSFPNISATFTIYYKTLRIDSKNSAIKSVRVILDEGSDNCTFYSNIDKFQHNGGTIESYSTFANVSIGYTRENKLSTKSETTVFTIRSDGTCKAL